MSMLTDTSSGKEEAKKPRRANFRRWWKRYYLRQFPSRKRMKGTFAHKLLGNRLLDPGLWTLSRDSVSRGLAVGTFMGLMPFFGLQIVFSLIACFIFRVNVTVAVVATFISNPFTAPGILWVQVMLGRWMSQSMEPADLSKYAGALKFVVTNGKALMLGSLATSALASLVAYLLTIWFWKGISKWWGLKHHHPSEPLDPSSGPAGP